MCVLRITIREMNVITINESRKRKTERFIEAHTKRLVELEALEQLDFWNYEEERKELAKWMLQTEFDVWVEIELRYEHTKELSVVQIQHRYKEILTTALNIMDRVFYGNNTDRKNERGTRFVYRHRGKSGINEHAHALVESDKRVSYTTYCVLLEHILKHLFIETSDKCSAGELEKSREHSAMYVSREYKQLKNDTLHTDITNIGTNDYSSEYNNDIDRRISRLKLKILRRALKAQIYKENRENKIGAERLLSKFCKAVKQRKLEHAKQATQNI